MHMTAHLFQSNLHLAGKKGMSMPSKSLYVVFAIVFGILLVVVVTRVISGLASPETEAFALANRIALHINALSGLEEGRAVVESERKFDFEIQKKGGFFRTVGQNLPEFLKKYIDKPGYYAVVTPYTMEYSQEKGEYVETKGESHAEFILSYTQDININPVIEGSNKVCVVKEAGKQYAEVMRC